MTPLEDKPKVSVAGISTPSRPSNSLSSLLSNQWVQETAARAGAALAAIWGAPLRVGTKVLVARHAQVMEVLSRDLDFLIAPVNAQRIDEVNGGHFVLGLDRGATLAAERQALYSALSVTDLAPIRQAVTDCSKKRVTSAKVELDVVGDYARPIAAATARCLFGVEGPDMGTFEEVARAIFAHTFLNLSGDEAVRKRALRAAVSMREWFVEEIGARRASGNFGSDMMGALLRDASLDDDCVRRTLGGMLVGSIDTTASSVAKIVWMIGKDARLKAGMAADADDEKRLAGWCREALRRWPHNPILLRRAAADTTLAGVPISRDDDVILWTHAAMFDTAAFPDPLAMRIDRPVASYLHFGAGLHPCAGRVINAFQIPLLVGALVRRGIRTVESVKWAGPFPDQLTVRFNR